jgi:hypothetical protein
MSGPAGCGFSGGGKQLIDLNFGLLVLHMASDLDGSEYGLLACFCEHGAENFGSIYSQEFEDSYPPGYNAV